MRRAHPASPAHEMRAVRAAIGVRTGSRLPVPLLLALLLLAVSVGGFVLLYLTQPLPMADLVVYRAEGRAVASGRNLYGFTVTQWDLPATYPPFAAMLFVPAAWLPLGAARAGSLLLNLVLLGLLAHLSLRFAGLNRTGSRAVPVIVAVASGLWLEPVFQTFVYGQINLALTVAVLWDLSRPDGARGKGVLTGIAAGLKLTPALFIVHLALTGRRRDAARATAVLAGTVLIGVAVLPGASVDFWTARLFETGRVGKAWIVDNQSLQGLFARLMHTTAPGAVWAVAAATTAAAGMTVAAYATRRGLPDWGLMCTAVTALLVSPISWSHHWVWCVPLLALLAAEVRGRPWRRVAVLGVMAVFTVRSMWLVPHQGDLDLRLSWWEQPAASAYPLLGLLFLVLAALRLSIRDPPAR